jgi:chorismate mutase
MANARVFSESLSDLRSQIDTCDDAIMGLLKKRMQIVADVANLKKKQNEPFIRPARETQILRRLLAESAPLPASFVLSLWRTLMMGALQYENPFHVGHVGEEGLKLGVQLFGALTPHQGFSDYDNLVHAYVKGDVDYVILPLKEASLWLASLKDIAGGILFHLPLMATSAEAIEAIVWGHGLPETSGQDFSWYYVPTWAPALPDAAQVAKTSEGSLWVSDEKQDDIKASFWGYTGLLG